MLAATTVKPWNLSALTEQSLSSHWCQVQWWSGDAVEWWSPRQPFRVPACFCLQFYHLKVFCFQLESLEYLVSPNCFCLKIKSDFQITNYIVSFADHIWNFSVCTLHGLDCFFCSRRHCIDFYCKLAFFKKNFFSA